MVWVKLSRMCVGPCPVLGVFEMSPYLGTRSDVLTMAVATSVSIFEKAQKNLGEFTHTISITMLVPLIMQYFSVGNGTM